MARLQLSLVGLSRTQDAHNDEYSLTFRYALPGDIIEPSRTSLALMLSLTAWFGPENMLTPVSYMPTNFDISFPTGDLVGTPSTEISIDLVRMVPEAVDRRDDSWTRFPNQVVYSLKQLDMADCLHEWLALK